MTVPKVCHLVLSLAPGGLERLVVDWTNDRNRRNPFSTSIVCLDENGALAAEVNEFPPNGALQSRQSLWCLQACRLRKPFDIPAVLRLRRLLRELRVTVLHSHNAAAWQYGAIATMGTGVCHVHTEHGTNPHFKGLANRFRTALLWRLTRRTVAVSESVAEELSVRHRIPRQSLLVIANGIPWERFLGLENRRKENGGKGVSTSRRMGLDDHGGSGMLPESGLHRGTACSESLRPCIGSVGRLVKIKGYDRLLAAFREFRRLEIAGGRVPPRLLMVGDGPERATLEQQAHALRMSADVTFAGFQPDPRPSYAEMDLFVLPSRSEGLPISLLEAMASGIPVAVTDVGESGRVVDGGRCGVILPQDENQWPGALSALLQDRAGMKVRADFARHRVRECYSMEATLAGYENLYKCCSGMIQFGD